MQDIGEIIRDLKSVYRAARKVDEILADDLAMLICEAEQRDERKSAGKTRKEECV
jgi:hypothetical protein